MLIHRRDEAAYLETTSIETITMPQAIPSGTIVTSDEERDWRDLV